MFIFSGAIFHVQVGKTAVDIANEKHNHAIARLIEVRFSNTHCLDRSYLSYPRVPCPIVAFGSTLFLFFVSVLYTLSIQSHVFAAAAK
jgi:hypothetical protein